MELLALDKWDRGTAAFIDVPADLVLVCKG